MPEATDLGYLLHKHPDKAQSFDVAVGTAHVLYPEAASERSTVALLLEVDVRGRTGSEPENRNHPCLRDRQAHHGLLRQRRAPGIAQFPGE